MVSQDSKSSRTGGRPTSFDCTEITNINGNFRFKSSKLVIFPTDNLVINVKMPTIVGILTFMTMINFMLF